MKAMRTPHGVHSPHLWKALVAGGSYPPMVRLTLYPLSFWENLLLRRIKVRQVPSFASLYIAQLPIQFTTGPSHPGYKPLRDPAARTRAPFPFGRLIAIAIALASIRSVVPHPVIVSPQILPRCTKQRRETWEPITGCPSCRVVGCLSL